MSGSSAEFMQDCEEYFAEFDALETEEERIALHAQFLAAHGGWTYADEQARRTNNRLNMLLVGAEPVRPPE